MVILLTGSVDRLVRHGHGRLLASVYQVGRRRDTVDIDTKR